MNKPTDPNFEWIIKSLDNKIQLLWEATKPPVNKDLVQEYQVKIVMLELQSLYFAADGVGRIWLKRGGLNLKVEEYNDFFDTILNWIKSPSGILVPQLLVYYEMLDGHEQRREIIEEIITLYAAECVCAARRLDEYKNKPIRGSIVDYNLDPQYETFKEFQTQAVKGLGGAARSRVGNEWKRTVKSEANPKKEKSRKDDIGFDWKDDIGFDWAGLVDGVVLEKKRLSRTDFLESPEFIRFLCPPSISKYLPGSDAWNRLIGLRIINEFLLDAPTRITHLRAEQLPGQVVNAAKLPYQDEWKTSHVSADNDKTDDNDAVPALELQAPARKDLSERAADELVEIDKNWEDDIKKIFLNNLPDKTKKRFLLRETLLINDEKTGMPKRTQEEIAAIIGCSPHTLRDDILAYNDFYQQALEKKKNSSKWLFQEQIAEIITEKTGKDDITKPEKVSMETDRTLFCTYCGIAVPSKTKKTDRCPACGKGELHRQDTTTGRTIQVTEAIAEQYFKNWINRKNIKPEDRIKNLD